MRVGSINYATEQGLGILAKSFYDAGVLTDFMVVRHGRRQTHMEWYPGCREITDLRSPRQLQEMKNFCSKMDAMLFFETPFRWELIDFCKEMGVKTFLMPMYECMPAVLPAQPDFFICPSLLDLQYYPNNSVFLPVPVKVEWKQRTTAKVFVHNAGHGGLKGRNGTRELVEALKYIKTDPTIFIRTQSDDVFLEIEEQVALASDRIDVHLFKGTLPQEYLWKEGDVFIFPEKFNGLSLPLQEARAAGMLVMCADRFPMNAWLPREPLIKVQSYRTSTVGGPCVSFQEAVISPEDIASKIDEWVGRDIRGYSEQGREWAKTMSWEELKPYYMETLSK